MRYYVEINGESSLDIQGLMIQSLPSISKPLIRSKQETIDGRDGDIVTKLGYSAYDKTLKIGLWGNYDINEVIAFFNQEGTITFSNEPDKYYRFTILNREDYVSQLDKFRTATIMIHCQPFKYKLNEEAEEIENEYTTQEGTSLTFNNSLVAPMNIDLKGNTLQNGTPTPSSPIPINNVSGDNQVVVCGKNLFDMNIYNTTASHSSCTIEITDNAINITPTGNSYIGSAIKYPSYVNERNRPTCIRVKPSTKYTFSISNSGASYLCYIDKNYQAINTVDYLLNNLTTYSFTTPSNCYYVMFRLGKNSGTTPYSFENIQLEENETATTYEAYNGTTYNIDLPVENLLNLTNNTYSKNGIDITINNNEILINGTASANTSITIDNVIHNLVGTYTISTTPNISSYGNNLQIGGYVYTSGGTYSRNLDVRDAYKTQTFTNGEYLQNIWVYILNGTQINNLRLKVQIEKGSKINTYTPYGTTPIELNKIGTYQDYIYKENNKWYLHKEIGKVVLNGSETGAGGWALYNKVFYLAQINDYKDSDNIPYCNYYKGVANVQGTSNVANNTVAFNLNHTDLPRLFIRNDNIASINDFTTWLSTHNTTIDYVLATPTNTEITYTPLIEQLESIKNAMSKQGTTNVNQVNNDAPFIINASVLTGTDSITITNEGNTTSKPILNITGSGVVGVYLENIQMFNITLGTNETIIIDTENMEAYYGSQLKNRQVTGDYSNFALQRGTNNLKFTGLITNVEITNYNRWI